MAWNSLFVELKRHVVGCLDYESRCNLRLCSKHDNILVKSTKYVAKLFTIEEERAYSRMTSKILIRFDNFSIRLTDDNNVTKIERLWMADGPYRMTYKTASRYDVARELIERMSGCNGQIETETMRIWNLSLEPSDHWRVKCRNLEMRMIGEWRIKLWLEKTVSSLDRLEISEWRMDDIGEILEHFRNTKHFLRLERDVVISDEQLEQITTPSVVIYSNDTLTEYGAKRAFKKYVEHSRIGDVFQMRFSIPSFKSFDPSAFFDRAWAVEKRDDGDVEGLFCFKITGGFENVHDVSVFPYIAFYVFPTYGMIQAHELVQPN